MDKGITLADALDEAARRIEMRVVEHNWNSMTTCNCGVLAQVVLGGDSYDLFCKMGQDASFPPFNWDGWSGVAAQTKCAITDLPLGSIFRALSNVGLDFRDLADLENLNDESVWREAGFEEKPRRNGRNNAARYMRAWSRLIRRDLPKSMPAADVLATKHPVCAEPALCC